jgi:hypothetical protein
VFAVEVSGEPLAVWSRNASRGYKLSDGSYALDGYSYSVRFLNASAYSTGRAITDLNEFTWDPDTQAHNFSYSETVAIADIPRVLGFLQGGTSLGWAVETEEVQNGNFVVNASNVVVSVSMNGEDWSLQKDVTFTYVARAVVTGLVPSHGPPRGLTEVLVLGSGFVKSAYLTCRFGSGSNSIVTAVHFLNDSAIICLSPPSILYSNIGVRVQVSNNLYYDDPSVVLPGEPVVVYTYEDMIVIGSIEPPLGPISGNITVNVISKFGSFKNTDELRCKFGNIAVQAMFVTASKIRCFAPPHPPGIYPLEVSNNDQDFSVSRVPFFYYSDIALSRISPVAGPAKNAGTKVNVYGTGFVNSSYLTCRFGGQLSPGIYVSSNYIICPTPTLDETAGGGLHYTALSEQFNRWTDPVVGTAYSTRRLSASQLVAEQRVLAEDKSKLRLFPTAYFYPLYYNRLVNVEVSNNMQDFTDSGINFLYQADAVVESILPNSGQVNTRTPIVVKGNNFVNSTLLRCRIGEYISVPTFLAPDLVLCFTPRIPLITYDHAYIRDRNTQNPNNPQSRSTDTSPSETGPNVVFVEVSNNGQDYTNNRKTFTFNIVCRAGHYCPQNNYVVCPPGTFCPGEFNANFTLCPAGTYNPISGQSACFRCPIGFICPEEGMQVPRICPPGFVCEVTGSLIADNPCPEGHFCLEGTATSSTTCGHPDPSSDLFPVMSHGERPSTLRRNRIAQGQQLFLGARNSGCWTNKTDDFGLQGSSETQNFWVEKHLLPLAIDSPFQPLRGRFCLDDKCLQLADYDNYEASDYYFDYGASSFKLRRPIPCPKGMYCHPGTGVDVSTSRNFTTPQPCFESMYCPEGSADPEGAGECPPGFYCPFGVRLACPPGTYCPRDGHWDPLPCPPGTFSAQLAISKCSKCPRGFICPGFGRVAPAICPPGFVCSNEGLRSPNQRCPAGYVF